MWDSKNYPKLSGALGGLSAILGGLSQLRHYARTKLGNCGLSQAIAD